MRDPRCNDDLCRGMSLYDVYRQDNTDAMLLVGHYCRRHAFGLTLDHRVWIRPIPAYVDIIVYPQGRGRS